MPAKASQQVGKIAPREQSYLFRILRCEPSYSLMIREFPGGRAPLEEFAHYHIAATCLFPPKLAERETQFSFLGRRSMAAELGKSAEAVGYLKMRGKTSEYLGALPLDVLNTALIASLLGGYRFIYLHGAPLYRGEAAINSFAFESVFHVSELADDPE